MNTNSKPDVIIITRRKLGLEVFEIYVRGVFVCERLSQPYAIIKANELAKKLKRGAYV